MLISPVQQNDSFIHTYTHTHTHTHTYVYIYIYSFLYSSPLWLTTEHIVSCAVQ